MFLFIKIIVDVSKYDSQPWQSARFLLLCLRAVHSSHRMYCNSKSVLLTNIQTSFLLSVPTVSFYKSKRSPSLLSKRMEVQSQGCVVSSLRNNFLRNCGRVGGVGLGSEPFDIILCYCSGSQALQSPKMIWAEKMHIPDPHPWDSNRTVVGGQGPAFYHYFPRGMWCRCS